MYRAVILPDPEMGLSGLFIFSPQLYVISPIGNIGEVLVGIEFRSSVQKGEFGDYEHKLAFGHQRHQFIDAAWDGPEGIAVTVLSNIYVMLMGVEICKKLLIENGEMPPYPFVDVNKSVVRSSNLFVSHSGAFLKSNRTGRPVL